MLVAVGAPVETELVRSLAAPGGNVTGPSAAYADIAVKWLELVLETAPSAKLIGCLENTGNPANRSFIDRLESAARRLGLELRVFGASMPPELDAHLAAMAASPPDVLIVGPDALLRLRQAEIIAFAERARVPTIYGASDYVDAGGLMPYGPHRAALGRQAAAYVAKIARGAHPSQLPMEEPTTFALVLNQKRRAASA